MSFSSFLSNHNLSKTLPRTSTRQPSAGSRLLAGCAITALSLCGTANLASAETDEPPVVTGDQSQTVAKLNREAMELFKGGDFQGAEKKLQEALMEILAGNLEADPLAAKTHGNLGAVYGAGLQDEPNAIDHFKQALSIQPDYKLPKELANAVNKRLLERARGEMPGAGEPADAAASAAADALKCPVPSTLAPGQPALVRCVSDGTVSFASVVVKYKSSSDESFKEMVMKPEPGRGGAKAAWGAKLPATATSGFWINLYFEARNEAGTVTTTVGTKDNPNVITMESGSQGEGGTADAGEGPQRKHSGGGQKAHRAHAEESTPSGGSWIGLGVGSGYGYAGSKGVEAFPKSAENYKAGRAPAALGHVLPEFGYFLDPSMAFVVQARLQYISGADAKAAKGAISGLMRLLFFSDGDGVRFYGGPTLGGGEGFRLVVPIIRDVGGDRVHTKDTVRGGPVVAGGSAGLSVGLNDTWSWVLEVGMLAGFPDFSVVFDLNTGLRVHL